VGLKCGVGCHPSTRLERLAFGRDELTMLEKCDMPVQLHCGGNDSDDVKPGGVISDAVVSSGGESFLYEDMLHGWVTRGDLSSSAINRDVSLAMERSFDFFAQHL